MNISDGVAQLLHNETRSFQEIQRENINFIQSAHAYSLPPLLIIYALAFLGNTIIVASTPYLSSPVRPYLQLCVSLAASDMWTSALAFTNLMQLEVLQEWLGVTLSSFCSTIFLEVTAGLISDWHIFALAMYQFIGILWPFKSEAVLTGRRLRKSFVFIWVVPHILVFLWFAGIPDSGLRSERCSKNEFMEGVKYRAFIAFFFFIPLIITIVLYLVIVCIMACPRKQMRLHKTASIDSAMDPRNDSRKLVSVALIIVCSFIMSHGIFAVYGFAFCPKNCLFAIDSIPFSLQYSLGMFRWYLLSLKLLGNPFIYTYRIEQFRRSVHRLFRSVKGGITERSESMKMLRRHSTRIATNVRTPR